MAFFGLGFTAPHFDNQTQPQDNPFLTCWTNPCVQVDGVGKIMGSTKVNSLNTNFFNIISNDFDNNDKN